MSAYLNKTASLLVELFVEELPPKALKKLGEAFGNTLFLELKKANAFDEGAKLTTYASPRRLAVHITEVFPVASAKPVKQKLMPVSVGIGADGKPTPALVKRLESLGLGYILKVEQSVWKERISIEVDGKNESLFHTDVAAGLTLVDNLQVALHQALNKLPIPKVMAYQLADGWSTVKFVRPVHGLVVLHGADEVSMSVLGLKSGRNTQGHRFEARINPVVISSADSYAAQMKDDGAVIASFAERRAEIVRQLQAAAAPLGLTPIDDDALLDEVTALVERPNVLVGKFEEAYLDVPQECLILTMKANQKYFPLLDAAGKLTSQFLIVSNISPDDASAVIQGNERVVRPRLADAKFFFDQDRKKTLESRVFGLAKVVYHNKLGTQGDRVTRVQAIARAIGQMLGNEELALHAEHAALLAKADLLTDMVGEFPELQGIMGRYYAQHDGLSEDIAFAIEDHYKPRFSGDELPRSDVGVCVALADKLETVLGMFQIGELPTGDKDPYALRRHALGIIRLCTEKNLQLSVPDLLEVSAGAFASETPAPLFVDRLVEDLRSRGKSFAIGTVKRHISRESQIKVLDFIFDRLSGVLRDQGFTAHEVDAVLAPRPPILADIPKRLNAVHAFAVMPEAPALAAANKRVGNILKKAEGGLNGEVNAALLQEPAEKALYQGLLEIAPKADKAFKAGDYTASLQTLAALKAPIDAFFDKVMVNTDKVELRNNRLALLLQLQQTMNRVADLSKLAT